MERDGKDFRELLVESLPRLRRFAVALTGSIDEGDDLAQAAVERALVNAGKWQPGWRFESWMFKIAQNIWIDRRRAGKVRGISVPLEDAPLASVEDGNAIAENRLMASKARQAIAELPLEQRSVVALVLIEGLSYREAAEVLEVPAGTIMSRLSRARRALEIALMPADLPGAGGGV